MKGVRVAAALCAALALWIGSAGAAGEFNSGQKNVDSGTSRAPFPSPIQGMFVGGFSAADTTPHVLHMTADGILYTQEYAPAREFVRDFGDVFSTDSIAVGARDSTLVPINVSGYRHLKLLVWTEQTRPSAATTVTQLAVSFAECADAQTDSNSVALDMGLRAADSLRFGHLVVGDVDAPYTGEFILHLSGLMTSGERAAADRQQRGIAIIADRIYGGDSWWRYLQIRVRNLSGTTVKVRMRLLGTAS